MFLLTGFLIGKLNENTTLTNGMITVSSEFNGDHGKDKLNIYNEDIPGAWCPREYSSYYLPRMR